MQINLVQDAAARFLKDNASTLLTAGGVVGTVLTGIAAFRGGFKAGEIVFEENDRRFKNAMATDTVDTAPKLSKTETFKLVWPHLVPPLVLGTATVGSIVGANMMSAKRAAALAAAYGVSQKQLDEYKAKVAEKLGVNKTEKLKDEMAQERVDKNPPPTTIVVMADEVLCYDKPTDRYFKSTMEKIRRAESATNREITRYGFAKAQFFYSELEIEPTTWTNNAGWNREIEVQIHHAIAKDERPCITIDFDHLPDPNYEMDYS